MRCLLEQKGMLCEECSDGKEAVQTVAKDAAAYDAIFLDNQMPNMVSVHLTLSNNILLCEKNLFSSCQYRVVWKLLWPFGILVMII